MAYQIPTAARLVSAPIVCRMLSMKQYDPDPAIDARIRRAVRYGQTRWAEIWFSVIMWVVGLTCLMPWPTFVGAQYRIITYYVSETTAGLIALAVGSERIVALYINGRRGRETSFVRTLGCLLGFLFWLAMALGFALAFRCPSALASTPSSRSPSCIRPAELPATWPQKTPSALGNGEGPVPATAQQLDGWPGIVIALLGAVAAVLVPLTGFMKEWWGYRKEVRAAEALKPDVARDVAATPGAAVFDSIALADLAKAINGLTAAIVADTASEEAQHTSQMTAAITRFTEVMDRWEDDHGRQPRGRR